MVRKIDEKKTRRALRRLSRARKAADEAGTPDRELSEWEGEFLGSLEERLETYGSAFNDPDKGNTEEALSARQTVKLREIEKKAKGKARKPMSRGQGFRRKPPGYTSRSRDINEDIGAPPAERPAQGPDPATPEDRRARFRVVRDDDTDV
ncbi:hypothetical protein [Maricaulis sp.]|uniref:hypothetical protein n=1 Tax=Maricaulis sp. TaxID=1486257 RepID=UPI002637271A|nr:hypothetical protein [Maricaulis sp.]